MNSKITFYAGIFVLLIGLWAFFSLVYKGFYNPLASADYYLGTNAWSPDSQQLRFHAHFPSDRIFTVTSNGHNLHPINTIPDDENDTNPFAQTAPPATEKRLTELLGEIDQYAYSLDTQHIAIVTSHFQNVPPLDVYGENLYIVDSTTYDIQFAANRDELMRFDLYVRGLIFPFRAEVRTLEIIALTGVIGGLWLIIPGFIRLNKKKIRLPLIIISLLFFYGSCAVLHRLSWLG
jgi:hypothetical protein